MPAAFSPTCQVSHLPGYVSKAKEIKSRGVDLLVCVSTDSVWAQYSWGRDIKVGNDIVMTSDGNGDWVSKLGLTQDLSKRES